MPHIRSRVRNCTYSQAMDVYFFNMFEGEPLDVKDLNGTGLFHIPDNHYNYQRRDIETEKVRQYFVDRYSNTVEGKDALSGWVGGWPGWYKEQINMTTADATVFINSCIVANHHVRVMKDIYEGIIGKISNFKGVRAMRSFDEMCSFMSPTLQDQVDDLIKRNGRVLGTEFHKDYFKALWNY